jgi:hypothetical protein
LPIKKRGLFPVSGIRASLAISVNVFDTAATKFRVRVNGADVLPVVPAAHTLGVHTWSYADTHAITADVGIDCIGRLFGEWMQMCIGGDQYEAQLIFQAGQFFKPSGITVKINLRIQR